MKSFLNLLKAPPYIDEIQDKDLVDKKYNYWRIRIFYSMFVGYAVFYFTRKSLTYAAPYLVQELNYDMTDVGLLGTLISLTYAFGKFFSGMFADRSNARYFMAIGLILTGIVNICFGFTSSMWFFAVLWAFNGLFQASGWPPCGRLLMHWYAKSERGTWWGLWNTSHNIGAALIAAPVAIWASHFGWQYGMIFPGIIAIFVGLFLMERLRDTPRSLGLPSIEKYRNEYTGNASEKDDKHVLSKKEILFEHVLKNKWVWILSFAYFFVYIVRQGINDWGNFYLVDKKFTPLQANICVSCFELGGMFGSLLSGWISDRFFKGQREQVTFVFMCTVPFTVIGFWLLPPGHIFLEALFLFLFGFAIFGPQMLIGVAVAEFTHKKAVGTATGLASGVFAYMGAAFAGYPLSVLKEIWGWNVFFGSLIFSCFFAMILLSIPLFALKKEKKKKEKSKIASLISSYTPSKIPINTECPRAD